MIPRIREWRRTTIRVEVKSNCQNLSDSRTTSIHMSTSNNIMNLFCSSWNFTYLMRTATRNENSIAEKLNDRIRFDIVIVFENIEIFSFEIRSLIVNKVRTIELPKFLKKGTNLFERFILFLFFVLKTNFAEEIPNFRNVVRTEKMPKRSGKFTVVQSFDLIFIEFGFENFFLNFCQNEEKTSIFNMTQNKRFWTFSPRFSSVLSTPFSPWPAIPT